MCATETIRRFVCLRSWSLFCIFVELDQHNLCKKKAETCTVAQFAVIRANWTKPVKLLSIEDRGQTDRTELRCCRCPGRASRIARTRLSTFWYKVRLTISLKTGHVKVPYFIRYSFYRHFSSWMTQHSATFNQRRFSDKSVQKSFSFSTGALPRTPLGYYDAPPDLVVRLGREIPPVHSSSASRHSASRCPVRLFNYDHLATLAVPIDSQRIVWLPISVL